MTTRNQFLDRFDKNPVTKADRVARRILRIEPKPDDYEDALLDLLTNAIEDRRRERARAIETKAARSTARDEYERERKEHRREQARQRRIEREERKRQEIRYRELIDELPDDLPDEERDDRIDEIHLEAYGRQTFRAIAREYEETVRLEITQELLATEFALYDGSRVTWGQATVEQHVARIRRLEDNAQGSLETAGRHRAAIEQIKRAGVTNLDQVAS